MFQLFRQQGGVEIGMGMFSAHYMAHINASFEKKMVEEPILKFMPEMMRAMAREMTVGISEKCLDVFLKDIQQMAKEYAEG
jgi:hypothetical protein